MGFYFTNSAEGGSNNTTVTAGNSGGLSGDAFQATSIVGSGTLTYSSNFSVHGNLAYKYTTTAVTGQAYPRWTSNMGPTAFTFYARTYLYIPSYPPNTVRVAEFRDNAAGKIVAINLGTTGRLTVKDANDLTVSTTTASVPTGSWVRIELRCVSHATLGEATLRLYLTPDSTTYDEQNVNTSIATNGNALDAAFFGLAGLNVANYTYYQDDMAVRDITYAGPAMPTQYLWRRAFEAVGTIATTTPLKVLAIGDSVTEGQGASTKANRWIDLLRDILRKAYPVAGVTGGQNYQPAFYGVYAPDSTWGSTGIADTGSNTNITWGGNLGYRGDQMAVGATRTLTVTGTTVDLWYLLNGGTISYAVDGGTAVSINTAGTYANAQKTNIPLYTPGSHTIKITAVSGTSYISGLTVYNGDETKGVHMYDSGHTGWLSADPLTDLALFNAALGIVAPDLVIIELGLNDAGSSVSTSTFQTNIQSLVTSIQTLTKDPSILLIASYEPSAGNLAGNTWANYVTALSNVAAADPTNVGFLDLSAIMPVADTSGTGYYRTDGLHPNDSGHVYIASLVAQMLGASATTPAAWLKS